MLVALAWRGRKNRVLAGSAAAAVFAGGLEWDDSMASEMLDPPMTALEWDESP
jgi:hypothetical protein